MLVGGGLFALAALAALRHTIFTGRNTPPVAEGEAELAAPSGTKEPKDLTVESEGSPVRNRNQLVTGERFLYSDNFTSGCMTPL